MSSTIQLSLMDEDPWQINQLLFNQVRDYLQPDSLVTTGDVVHCLDSLFHRYLADQSSDSPHKNTNNFFWNIWEPFHIVARQLPHDSVAQEKLIECLCEIRSTTSKTPVVTVEDTSGTHPAVQYRLWQDMCQFSGKFWEMARFMGCEKGIDDQWWNFMAYGARLTRDGIADLSYFGNMSLNEALREAIVKERHPKDRRGPAPKTEFTLHPKFEYNIAVAADWIGYAGDSLFEKFYKDADGKASAVEGWQFWKRRFGEIAQDQQIPQGTRELAKATKENMEATKKAMQGRTQT